MRFGELRQKEVVNVLDGKRLGTAIDMEFDAQCGQIKAIIVPGPFSVAKLIKGAGDGVVIPWGKICKIGDDVVLVELDAVFLRSCGMDES